MAGGRNGKMGFTHCDVQIGLAAAAVATVLTFNLARATGLTGWGLLGVTAVPVALFAAVLLMGDSQAETGCALVVLAGVAWGGLWLGLKGWLVAIPPAVLLVTIVCVRVIQIWREEPLGRGAKDQDDDKPESAGGPGIPSPGANDDAAGE